MQCPRCRQGKIFQNKLSIGIGKNLAMHTYCPTCAQPTEVEVGFYYGTGYVSYALTVALTAFTFVTWVIFIGISTEDNRIFWWLGLNALLLIILQPWIMRFSRSLWLSWFVKYNANWRNTKINIERINKDQMEGRQDINIETLH
jgi:hypothetical protein